jgi:hypothetical protein
MLKLDDFTNKPKAISVDRPIFQTSTYFFILRIKKGNLKVYTRLHYELVIATNTASDPTCRLVPFSLLCLLVVVSNYLS